MKKITLFVVLVCAAVICNAQEVPAEKVVHLDSTQTHRAFWYTGENAKHILNQLYKSRAKDVAEKSIHRFKGCTVEGIDGALTFKVLEGVHYVHESGKGGGFHTYTGKKDRAVHEAMLAENKRMEVGIIVHVLDGREDIIDTAEEEQLVLAHFRKMLDAPK